MCPALLEVVFLVQHYSGNTHEKCCFDVHGSRRAFFDQCFTAWKSRADFPPLLSKQLLGQGEGEFSFHDSSIPGLLRRQPATGRLVAIVMGRWWCGYSRPSAYFTRAIRRPFLFRKAGPETLNLKNSLFISYQTLISTPFTVLLI